MPTTYRAALIGCGRMGATIDDEIRASNSPVNVPTLPWAHAAGFVASPRTDLIAVSDMDADKAETIRARYDVPKAYTDYQEMIRVERPELVGIATRPATHAEMVVFAAENGVKGIYCEKPFCCSPEEADRMADAVEGNGVKFNYGANRRYSPLFRELRRRIDSGEIGKVESVIAYCGAASAQWWHTHSVDLFVNMASDAEVDYVQATLRLNDDAWDGDRLDADPPVELGYVVFKNGVRAYLTTATGR
ncbi:MAG: Gfo/Idh/MocA family oxidoreductase, partial [Candidatus Poribacteria bacterium]|nr:Gfo/Idh/MocA family oxidoreductase [Candidatus Poribacteria bacterium]